MLYCGGKMEHPDEKGTEISVACAVVSAGRQGILSWGNCFAAWL
jgi:hypothetical protein